MINDVFRYDSLVKLLSHSILLVAFIISTE